MEIEHAYEQLYAAIDADDKRTQAQVLMIREIESEIADQRPPSPLRLAA